MSLNRLHSLVYLAVAVVVYTVGDLHSIGADPVLPIVAVADGGVVIGMLTFGAATPAESGAVSPPVHVQIEAPQATRWPGAIGADRGGFGFLHGLTVALDGFGGTGEGKDEVEHGGGII